MWQHPPVNRALGRALWPLATLAIVAAPIFAAGPAFAADQNVAIVDFAFQPGDVSISLNEKVTWFNQSPDNHTVTSDTQAFDSGSLPPYGGGYQLIFQRSGTFAYHCAFHPQMRGVVRVGTGSGGTPPPPVTTTPRPPTPPTPPSPPTTPRPGGTTTTTLATTVLPPPGGATTTSTTPLAGIVTTTSSSSSTTSTTSLFSTPTTGKNVASGSNSDNDRTKRRVAGAIAAALAAAGTLATIFVARRPVRPAGYADAPEYETPPPPGAWGT
jgi:plastocyanin